MEAARSLAKHVGIQPACDALGVARATYYRRTAPAKAPEPRPEPPLKLAQEEVEEVVRVLHSPRFVDQSPRQIWATLLDDDDRYLCSVRTMYRILDDRKELKERRNQLRHPEYTKPELLATRPNEVWSWDITKVKGPSKGSWFHLYVILDIFSRCVVGWLLAAREKAGLAKELIRAALEKQGIGRDQLTIHADRGPSMMSKSVALLLSGLGVDRSHSRPYNSNDNPFSEAQFKTLKYHSSFPERFGSQQDARVFFAGFFKWYNTQHRHTQLALMTPADVHYGRAPEILKRREASLLEAFKKHPNRFKGRAPVPGHVPEAVWINPPPPEEPSPAQPETPGPADALHCTEVSASGGGSGSPPPLQSPSCLLLHEG